MCVSEKTYLQSFETKCSSEVSMGIFRVALDHCTKVFDGLVVILNHLVGFGSLVHIPYIVGNPLNTATEWPNRLLKFLNFTVR
jgi:hypothetical protein